MGTKRKIMKFVAEPELVEDFEALLKSEPAGTTKIDLFRVLIRDRLEKIKNQREIVLTSTVEEKINRLTSICHNIENKSIKTNEIVMRIYNIIILFIEAVEYGMSMLIGKLTQDTPKEDFDKMEKQSKINASNRTLAKYMISQRKTSNVIARLKRKTEYKWMNYKSTDGKNCSKYTNGETTIFFVSEYLLEKDGKTIKRYRAGIVTNKTYEFKQFFETLDGAQKYIEPLKEKLIQFWNC